MKSKVLLLATTVALAVASLSGCTVEGSHGSRSDVYDSVADMLTDTSDVVVGTVVKREPVDGEQGDDITFVTLEVKAVHTPAEAGTGLPEGYNVATVREGSNIVIRQHGLPTYEETLAPFLEEGESYLLFLSPANNEGEAASQFTIVGVTAGAYVQQGDEFRALTEVTEGFTASDEHAPPDNLPITIDPASLKK